VREVGTNPDALERFECLDLGSDRHHAPPLEHDERVFGIRMTMPGGCGPGWDHELAHGECRAAEVAGRDEQPPGDAILCRLRRVGAPSNRFLIRVPAAEHRADPSRIRIRRREQGERVDLALVPDEVVLGRCLVQDITGGDDRPSLELLAVLEHDLATREIDDRLDAMTVWPDLGAGWDAVELEPDRHRAMAERIIGPV
jgi:hypothetical protein